jgi:hypothetical protein
VAIWDSNNNVVTIINPSTTEFGTVLKPDDGYNYFIDNFKSGN